MTAVVDEPFVMSTDNSPVERRRRRDSVEVIDQNDLNDDERAAFQRPAQRRRITPHEVIVIDDDGDIHLAASSSSGQRANRPRLRSLPPPTQDTSVPPVPPIPRRFVQPPDYPMRRRAPPHPGVVRPSAQPFAFEAHMRHDNPIRHRHNTPAGLAAEMAPLAASRSHHIPSMGFGGALLSLNRQNQAVAIQERRNRRQRIFDGFLARARQATQQWLWPDLWLSDDNHALRLLIDIGEEEDLNNLLHILARDRNQWRNADEYKPECTHPIKPESGFVHDFASPHDANASSPNDPIVIEDDDSSTASTVLVCAHCLDPLVLGGGLAAMGPEEEKHRKVWGLRCGHLIDGKCLEEISKPSPSPTLVEEPAQIASEDIKGKGKAKAVDSDYEGHTEEHNYRDGETPMPVPRYALRSRGGIAKQSLSAPSSNVPPPRDRGRGASSKPSANTRRKAKSSNKDENKIEETYEWQCPVLRCGHLHASVKVNGVWEAEKDKTVNGHVIIRGRGAIPCFV